MLDGNFVAELGAAETLSIARNRPFEHHGTLGVTLAQLQQMAVWSAPVGPGQLVQVSPRPGGEQYSPTCLLQQMAVPDPRRSPLASPFDGAPPFTMLSPSGTETCGPEGFTLTRQGSEQHAVGVDDSVTNATRVYAGARAEVCAGGDTPFGSAKACGYAGVEVSTTRASTSSDTRRESVQVSAALSDGLRDARAPFPEAPVGALLLVTVAEGQVVGLDVATRAGLSATVDRDATAYLVVNDLACDAVAGAPALTVEVRRLVTEAAAARATVEAIAVARQYLRRRATHYLAQKTILGAERAPSKRARAGAQRGAGDRRHRDPRRAPVAARFCSARSWPTRSAASIAWSRLRGSSASARWWPSSWSPWAARFAPPRRWAG